MEVLLQQNLEMYYLLICAIIGIASICNVKKDRRIGQIGIAQAYIIIFVIFVLTVLIEKVFGNFVDNISNVVYSGTSAKVFVKLAQVTDSLLSELVETHHIILLCVIAIVDGYKFLLKQKYKIDLVDVNIISKKLMYKFCFDENVKLNEKGRILSKISQNIAYTMIIWYLIVPIFWHYEVEVFYSSIVTIFLAITFLEVHFLLSIFEAKFEEDAPVKKSTTDGWAAVKTKLGGLLKLSASEKRENSDKTILNKNANLFSKNNLICEVPNFEQFRAVNMGIMNNAFFENKKVLVISSSLSSAKEYYKNMNTFNKEYDGKLAMKLLTEEDKIFDKSLDIYITTLEICFGNINLLNKIDTIIIEDIDLIMQNKLELLRAFGSIVKMGNSDVRYVVLSYMLQGIEAAVKNLLLIDDITWYNFETKQQSSEIKISIWDKKNVEIGDGILAKVNKNIGNLIPLALLSTKSQNDRTLIISKDDPIEFQVNELNNIKSLEEKKVTNSEIEELNKSLCLSRREKYFEYKEKNYIVAKDSNYNIYDAIYKLSLINGKCNHINILSSQYLLRDYMVKTYQFNKNRLKQFLPYVQHEVNNSKVILHSLILQLTNYGVSENVLIRIFNQNNINVIASIHNSTRIIAQALNKYIKREFNISIDTYSYLVLREHEDKFIFDANRNSFVENEPIYILDKAILRLLPNALFKAIRFSKDGFIINAEKEYSYNFYQKYLPGQRHALDGTIYKIKDIIEVADEIDAIVEASTNYGTNIYRQVRKINILSDMNVIEKIRHTYKNISVDYILGTLDCDIITDGYYEFNNGVTFESKDYRYIQLADTIKERVKRSYKNSKVLKIDISLLENAVPEVQNLFGVELVDKLSNALAFILSETLVSMLGENSSYIQVKAKVSNSFNFADSTWVYPIESGADVNKSIEILVFEDVELERGLIDMIYKNLDNILEIMHDYLVWVLEESLPLEVAELKSTYSYLTSINSMSTYCKELVMLLSEAVLAN